MKIEKGEILRISSYIIMTIVAVIIIIGIISILLEDTQDMNDFCTQKNASLVMQSLSYKCRFVNEKTHTIYYRDIVCDDKCYFVEKE